MRKPLRLLGVPVAAAVVTAVAIPLLSSTSATAAGFTGGNLVVYRVGDGTSALTNAAARVYVDEYSPTGTKVQSVPLPIAASDGNLPLTAVGQSRSEGLIARSADGRFVTLTGYAAAPGATGPGGISLTASNPTNVSRVVGIVDAHGFADTSTELNAAGTAQIIRSAVSTNGDRLWATGGNGGIVTTTLGSATVKTLAGDDDSNLNALTVQDDQLFVSGILANRLGAVGTGTPAGTATVADLTGLPDNLLTYGYSFLDLTGASYNGTGLDTLYVANSSERGGTVDKYRYNGTTWALVDFVDVDGAFGLVADVDGSAVSLAITTPTQLINVTDPAGAANTFNASDPDVLATAAANTEFRGVALAPTADPGPSVFLRKPASGTTVDLSKGTVTVSAYVDSEDGIDGVTAKIGTGAAVAATKGAGNIWTAKVPAAGLKVGKATLTVTATDSATTPLTSTVKRKITLEGSSTPKGNLGAGTYAWSNKLVKLKGTWKTYKTTASPSGKGETSKAKNDTAKAKVYGKKLVLTFGKSPKAGKVKVTVDGKSTTLNLYAAKKGNLAKTWTFKGAVKTHTVTITVLGTKSAKSKGTAVFLAALKVQS
jgi:hypothetical protein